ncbi:MAG: DGQHR domain-containing protein [Candidatus Pacebacteria bacterium]|nr:DGQHR domain-containing protein [Candidatus Paceibacterota bacterium]
MKNKSKSNKNVTINALKVNQWLKEWGSVEFIKKNHRREPEKCFYIFSLSARQLRFLSGVNRRDAKDGKKRSGDMGIQRAYEQSRSKNIAEYVKYGYPWSDLTKSQRQDGRFDDLRKPGWLPTAIVVNILTKEDKRNGGFVAFKDLITIDQNAVITEIKLPFSKETKKWKPEQVHPLEVIDGQHRLLAFDENINEDYELPVVAFYGLDLSWQAYLFWTINIKPKRINPSLAFDLYPLLRTEDWLDRFEGHKVYREARAQEIVELLWSEPTSSWYQRINMLGESGDSSVTQAAWIRALLKTYIKTSEGKGVTIGGLFGAPAGHDEMTIPWNRSQQAALLIYLWNSLEKSIKELKVDWAKKLRETDYKRKIKKDPAFYGPHTLLNNDQGISVVLNITNDILFRNTDKLNLKKWKLNPEVTVSEALDNLLKKQQQITVFIDQLTIALSTFDWRSSAAENLSEIERTLKLSFRGGSGYREFRRLLLKHLSKDNKLGKDAKAIYKNLGFDGDVV